MRAEMFEVIVERPRWGSRHAPPVKLKKDKNGFKHIGLKRHVRERADYSKSLNENLAPLVCFLQRRVARDGVLKDRVWFWRDHGHVVPPGKQHLGWKDAAR